MSAVAVRLANEIPTVAVAVATILGVSEADLAAWKELVGTVCTLIVWITVRGSTDGPATQVRRRRTDDAADG